MTHVQTAPSTPSTVSVPPFSDGVFPGSHRPLHSQQPQQQQRQQQQQPPLTAQPASASIAAETPQAQQQQQQNAKNNAVEAALWQAVQEHNLQERTEVSSVPRAQADLDLECLQQRHNSERMQLLRRHEQEIGKVKQFLERQLEEQNSQTENLKLEHSVHLNKMQEARDVALRACPPPDRVRVQLDHDARLSTVQARQAEELGARQASSMQCMQLQEEELARVRALHRQQQKALQESADAEVQDMKSRHLQKANANPAQLSTAGAGAFASVRPSMSVFPETNYALSHLQRLESRTVDQRFAQGVEYSQLLKEHEAKRLQHDAALKEMQEEAMRSTRIAATATGMQEDEIRSIRERTEQDFANRLKLQQLHEQEQSLSHRLVAKERQMTTAMSQFEKQITHKEFEVQQIRNELGRQERDNHMKTEELRHKNCLLQERDFVLPQLQERLQVKERELHTLLSDYNVQRIEMARSVDDLRAELANEGRKGEQLRSHVAELSDKVNEKTTRLTALESDLANEKQRAAAAQRNAEQLKPEVEHWRRTAETNTTTQHILEDQIRVCQEVNDREIRMRDSTISELRSEADGLRMAVTHLTEQLASSQKAVESHQLRDLQQQQRELDLKRQARTAEEELAFSGQALEALSARNQELEKLHMDKVVSALERRLFSDGPDDTDPLPTHPSRMSTFQQYASVASPMAAHGGGLSTGAGAAATPQDVEKAYAPVVDSLAKFLQSNKTPSLQ